MMNRRIGVRLIMLVALAIVLSAGVAFAADDSTIIKVKSISMAPRSLTLYVGDAAYQATADILPRDATNPDLVWRSSNPKIALVDQTGLITPIKAGSVKVAATATDGSKKSATLTVTVKNVIPTSVTLSHADITLKPGETISLTALVSPDNATLKGVTWKSSYSSRASVSSGGVVTAKKPGVVRITATTKSGSRKAVCIVRIPAPIKPTSISLSSGSATLYIGDEIDLNYVISPTNAEDQRVSWSSSSKSIATVDANGVVKAMKAGSTTITVTTKSGGKKAKCKVTVKPILPTSLQLNHTDYSLKPSEKLILTSAVLPSNATNKNVTWSSSNTRVAKVSSSGVVTTLREGTAKIVCKTKTGGLRAECALTVSKTILPTSVTLSQSLITIEQYKTVTLTATVLPENAANRSVTWQSSNASVAQVSASGEVTGRGVGQATITVRTALGDLTAQCVVNVTSPPVTQVTYRAFLIGNSNYPYPNALAGPLLDVKTMSSALQNAGYSSVVSKTDLTASEMISLLTSMQTSGIRETDVTLFYYSGHGNSGSGRQNGALIGVNGGLLMVDTVQQYLDKVPGTVIVVLDSCLSGQFIEYVPRSVSQEVDPVADIEAFNASVIKVFGSGVQQRALPDSPYFYKYRILTAASALEYSYSVSQNGAAYSGLFSYYFSRGSGYDAYTGWLAQMHADQNGDSSISVEEMYKYTRSNVTARATSIGITQNVMGWWPEGGNQTEVVFRK